MSRRLLTALAILFLLLTAPALAQPLGPDRPCAPGQLVSVSGGSAPPNNSLLLTWAGRAVGGGVADRTGRYNLTLAVGHERPGSYDVAVVVRDSREPLQRFRCVVPGVGAPPPAPVTPRAMATTPSGAATPTPALSLTPTIVGERVTPAWWPCEEGQLKGSQNDIYHAPGQRDYDRTYVDVTCFDTAAEAEAAGYRAVER
jgi:hypothetical protein